MCKKILKYPLTHNTVILGAPLWIPVILTVVFAFLSVYILIWSAIITLYAADFTIAVSGIACVALGVVCMVTGKFAQFALLAGAGLACGGIAILLFFAFNQITKWILILSKKGLLGIKSCFIK